MVSRLALRAMAMPFFAVAALSCKTNAPSSNVAEFEKPEYAGLDVCRLVKDEATQHVTERGQSFAEAYAEVFNREAGIFALLVPKARICGSRRATLAKAGSMPPPGSVVDPMGPDDTASVDAGAKFPAEDDPECDSLTAPGRADDLEAKFNQLKNCDPSTMAGSGAAAGLGLADDQAPATPVASSEICAAMGIDNLFCRGAVASGVALSTAQLDKLCGAAGAFLKAQALGKYDTAGMRDCGADIVQEICSRNVWAAAGAVKAVDDASKKLNEKIQNSVRAATKSQGYAFASAIVKCGAAIGKDQIKTALAETTAAEVKSLFTQNIGKAETWLRDQKRVAIISAACAVGAGIAGATMGRYQAKDMTAECADFWKADKQRAQACVSTVKEIGCDAVVGKIDLATSLEIGDDAQAAKLFADLTSGVLEGACMAGGGKVGSAACSLIARSSGYIADAFRGKSNPWADCLGTPALGACVADKWHYWSTGVMVDDYKVGVAEPVKKPDEKFYNNVCWCWRKCMSDDWGTDREVHKDLYWETATKSDAGVRFCAGKERRLTYPSGLTWENGRRNVYIQYSDCCVSPARGDAENLWDDKGFMEIFAEGKWGWYKFPRTLQGGAMGCGGQTDQGI